MTTALITGASGGIGAVYAERLAARGHDLVLVARATAKLEELAARLAAEHGVTAQVITADLSNPPQLELVSARLRSGGPVDILVNNAGSLLPGTFEEAEPAQVDGLIRLNVTAPTLLAQAAIPGMMARGGGAIINIGSVVGLAPERFPGVYAATKSYVLTLSQGLAAEFAGRGLYVQAVLPAATRTEIWARGGRDVDALPGVMEVGDLVDAALSGFDRREPVTIPALADVTRWDSYEGARQAMVPGFFNARPAARYTA